MSDARPPLEVNELPAEDQAAAAPARRPSMFDDPVVRWMGGAAIAIVVLVLATVLGVLAMGVISPTGPRSLTEKELAVAGAAVAAGSKNPAEWGDYIAALIANEQYFRAERAIAEGRRSVDDSATADFDLAEARLLAARKRNPQAIKVLDKAMKQMEAAHKKALKAGGTAAMTARVEGLPDNHDEAVLLKAYILVDMEQYAKAVKQFDVYLKQYPRAADILIDRANAKAQSKDLKGAEKDFRAALRYVPDDEEALAGLKKIGASK